MNPLFLLSPFSSLAGTKVLCLFVDTRDRYVAFYGGNPLLLLTQTFRFVRIIRTRAWMKRGFEILLNTKRLRKDTRTNFSHGGIIPMLSFVRIVVALLCFSSMVSSSSSSFGFAVDKDDEGGEGKDVVGGVATRNAGSIRTTTAIRTRKLLSRSGLPIDDLEEFETWDVGGGFEERDDDDADDDEYEDKERKRAEKRLLEKREKVRVRVGKLRARRADKRRAKRLASGEDVLEEEEDEAQHTELTDEEILAEYEDEDEEENEEEEDAFDRNDLRDRDDPDDEDDDYALKTTEELRQTKKAMDLFDEDDDEEEEDADGEDGGEKKIKKKKRPTSDLDEYEDIDEVDLDYDSEGVHADDENDVFREDDEYEDEQEYDLDSDDDEDVNDEEYSGKEKDF